MGPGSAALEEIQETCQETCETVGKKLKTWTWDTARTEPSLLATRLNPEEIWVDVAALPHWLSFWAVSLIYYSPTACFELCLLQINYVYFFLVEQCGGNGGGLESEAQAGGLLGSSWWSRFVLGTGPSVRPLPARRSDHYTPRWPQRPNINWPRHFWIRVWEAGPTDFIGFIAPDPTERQTGQERSNPVGW